jgi:quercetin dioxygenase-like cupin family protein
VYDIKAFLLTGDHAMTPSPMVQERALLPVLQAIGTDVRLLCDAAHTGGRFSMLEVMLPLGSGPPPHHHDWDEAYYVADGTVQFKLGERELHVAAGDFVYAPAGTVHGFSGTSEAPARMLILDTPAHAAGFFRDLDREVRVLPQDLSKVPVIGERHGVHFLPPPGALPG